MTFWERLEKALDENNITASELSRKIGIASSVIYSWKLRDSIPRADVAVKAAEILNTSVEYLISGELKIPMNNKKTFLVPLLNQSLSAGKGDILPEDDIIHGFIEVPEKLREYKDNLAGLYVHGDSMEPTLNNGDMIICDSCGWDKQEGLYAIRMNGNGYVKRIQVSAKKILIKSDNPKYDTIQEPIESDSIQIIGKVHYVIKHV